MSAHAARAARPAPQATRVDLASATFEWIEGRGCSGQYRRAAEAIDAQTFPEHPAALHSIGGGQ